MTQRYNAQRFHQAETEIAHSLDSHVIPTFASGGMLRYSRVMKIREITLHNYRSIKDATFYAADYGLLIGANNCGKTSVLDALRNFYEKDIKFDQQRDFPKFPTDDKESWVEIEYERTKDEADSIKTEYRQPGSRLDYFWP